MHDIAGLAWHYRPMKRRTVFRANRAIVFAEWKGGGYVPRFSIPLMPEWLYRLMRTS